MSSFILILLVGLILIGAIILVAAVFFDDERTERQLQKQQQQLSSITDPNQLIEMAKNYESNEQWEAAVRTWSRYLELKPEAYDGLYRRGVARLKQGHSDEAIDDLETVREESDSPPEHLPLYLGRAYHNREESLVALGYFEDYLESFPDDLSVCREAAAIAREYDKPTRARNIYERLREMDKLSLQMEGTLALAEIDLDDGNTERAEPYLDELGKQLKQDNLSDRQQKEYLYQRARYQEALGNQDQADELYKTLYGQDPDHRDVRQIVEEKIQNMSEDQLIKNMLRMNRDDFIDYCEQVVEDMGYEVMKSDSINPEEVQITAREKAQMLKVNRVLFAFKKWDNQAGEIPVKEFEMMLLEKRYDRGFFVCPGGFNHKALEYADSGRDMELIGPERLLDYLRAAEKNHIT